MRTFADIVELEAFVGEHLGTSEWVQITQPMIDAFGEVTGSDDWIHTDPRRAEAGIFGGTIAQGDLITSLLPRMLLQLYRVNATYVGMVYGSDRVRLPSIVPVEARVRAGATVRSVDRRANGFIVTLSTTMEIEDSDRPAVVAEILHYYTQMTQ